MLPKWYTWEEVRRDIIVELEQPESETSTAKELPSHRQN